MQRRGRSGSKAKVRADAHDPRCFDAIAAGVKARDKPLVRIVSKDDAGASEPAADGSRALRDEDLVLIRSQLRAAALAEAQSEALSSQLALGSAVPHLPGAPSLPSLPPVDLQQELEIMEAEEFLITADELPEAFGATDVGMLTGLVQEATAGLDLEPFAAALGVDEPFASVLGDKPLSAAAPDAAEPAAAAQCAAPPIPTVPPTPQSQDVAVASVAPTPSDAAAPAADASSQSQAAASDAASSSAPAPVPALAAAPPEEGARSQSAAEARDDAALLDACFATRPEPPSPTRTPSPASATNSPPASPDPKRVGSARREGGAAVGAAGDEEDARMEEGDEAASVAGSDETSATAEVCADADADAEPSPPKPSPVEQSLTGKRRATSSSRQPAAALAAAGAAAAETEAAPANAKRRRRGPPASATAA